MNKEEVHCLIIWNNSRHKESQIEVDIKCRFSIVSKLEIFWDKERFSENLSRFYGASLPPNCGKEELVGTGPFLLYILKDAQPLYDVRPTSKGPKLVNINIFDSKMKYRQWTAPGSKVKSTIHATNDYKEAMHDIVLLTGNTYKYFLESPCKPEIEVIKGNLIGADGWDDLRQVFSVLNECSQHVVLRNFNNFFEQPISEEHTDVDILTSDYDGICRITNSIPTRSEKFRVQNRVLVGGIKINFDFRTVGDYYYDSKWGENIIKDRVVHGAGFFVPNEINFFYSLLYHAIIHKNRVSENYIEDLCRTGKNLNINVAKDKLLDKQYGLELLSSFMFPKGYEFVTPKDFSVGFNNVDKPFIFSARKRFWHWKKKMKKKIRRARLRIHAIR